MLLLFPFGVFRLQLTNLQTIEEKQYFCVLFLFLVYTCVRYWAAMF